MTDGCGGWLEVVEPDVVVPLLRQCSEFLGLLTFFAVATWLRVGVWVTAGLTNHGDGDGTRTIWKKNEREFKSA